MKNKLYLILISIFLIIILINISALAHRVIIFAYIEGDKIHTESYFSDGTKCVNSKIEVFDDQGNKLLEGLTDDKGVFIFEIPQATALKIVLTANMGHRAECYLSADELAGTLGENKRETPITDSNKQKESISSEIPIEDLKSFQLLIEDILDKKLKPFIGEIRRLRKENEKIKINEVIGGIGYIFGIMGIIAYFLSRKSK